jgi:hypothetical protein
MSAPIPTIGQQIKWLEKNGFTVREIYNHKKLGNTVYSIFRLTSSGMQGCEILTEMRAEVFRSIVRDRLDNLFDAANSIFDRDIIDRLDRVFS